MFKEAQAARARVAQRMAMENYLRCFTRHEFDWLRGGWGFSGATSLAKRVFIFWRGRRKVY
jgi:hypothetical protein